MVLRTIFAALAALTAAAPMVSAGPADSFQKYNCPAFANEDSDVYKRQHDGFRRFDRTGRRRLYG